jgi:hypothetical protein
VRLPFGDSYFTNVLWSQRPNITPLSYGAPSYGASSYDAPSYGAPLSYRAAPDRHGSIVWVITLQCMHDPI